MGTGWSSGGLGLFGFLSKLWKRAHEHRILDQSAKLSFYFLLSAFPFLMSLTALLGFFLRSDSLLEESLNRYLASIAPESSLKLITNTIAEVERGTGGVKFSLALLFTWWSSSRGVAATVEGLNIAYSVRESRSWWRQQIVVAALTLMLLLFTMVTMMVMFGVHRLFDEATATMGSGRWVVLGARAAEWIILLAFMLFAIHVLYTLGPNLERRKWIRLLPGTVLALVLWVAASQGFRMYLIYFDQYSLTYGSIGAVIVLLLWFYLSGVAILAGAEVNSLYQHLSDQTGPEGAAKIG